MMNRVLLLLLTLLSLGLSACSASADLPTTKVQVITLDGQASQLRHDFNKATASVRLLFIVDPACSVCLRGLADMNDALLAAVDDPRLQTFVVHASVIGGTLEDVVPSSALLKNGQVHHYWDPTGNFGRQVSASLQLKRGDEMIYAWDVWMIYNTDATLPAEGTVPPALFMHQLPKLRGQPGRPFLDSKVFAAKARELLAQLPPVTTAK